MLENIEALLHYSKEFALMGNSQDSLFGGMEVKPETLVLSEEKPIDISQKLMWEKELLGLYVSGHPLDKYKEILDKQKQNIREIKKEVRVGMPTVVYGIVEEIKPIMTKKGDRMAFLRIADFSGNIETVIFPKLYAKHKDILKNESCIGIKGRISKRNGEISIIAEVVKTLT